MTDKTHFTLEEIEEKIEQAERDNNPRYANYLMDEWHAERLRQCKHSNAMSNM